MVRKEIRLVTWVIIESEWQTTHFESVFPRGVCANVRIHLSECGKPGTDTVVRRISLIYAQRRCGCVHFTMHLYYI